MEDAGYKEDAGHLEPGAETTISHGTWSSFGRNKYVLGSMFSISTALAKTAVPLVLLLDSLRLEAPGDLRQSAEAIPLSLMPEVGASVKLWVLTRRPEAPIRLMPLL